MSRLCQNSDKDVALTSVKDNDLFPSRHDRRGPGDDDYNVPKSVLQCEPVGTCTTVGATAAKTVTLDNDSFPDFVLRKGRSILVEFTNSNTANAPTLDVNGTGAYPIACIGGNAQVGSGCWVAGATMEFTFSGTKWLMHSNIVAQDTNVSSGYTSHADGTTSYTAAQVNGALTDYNNYIEITDANNGIPPKKGRGFYRLWVNSQNVPSSSSAYFLESFYSEHSNKTQNVITQILTTIEGSITNKNKQYMRTGTTSNGGTSWTWSSWEKITTESDLSNKATWKARKTFATDRTPLDIQISDILQESIVIFDSGNNFAITMAQFRGQQVSITRVAGTSSITVTDIGNHTIRITPTTDYVRVGVLAY